MPLAPLTLLTLPVPSRTSAGVPDASQVPALVFKNEMLCRYGSVRRWHAADSPPALEPPASPSAPAAPAFVPCQTQICRWEERRPLSTPIQINSKTRSPCISGPDCATFGQRSTCFRAEADLKALGRPSQGSHKAAGLWVCWTAEA